MTTPRLLSIAALAIAVASSACQGAPDESAAPEPAQEVSVTVAPIVRTTLHAYVEGWGRVEPEPASEGRAAANARSTSPVSGVVTHILATEGQRVSEGTVLFRLDSRVADVTILRAQQAVQIAEQLVARQEELGPGQATSQKAYEEAVAQRTLARSELSAAELQRRLLEVRAPITGTLVSVNARLGDAIDPSTMLAEMVDLTRLVVSATIRSVDVPRVKWGQRVEFSLGAEPGNDAEASTTAHAGRVAYIASQVDTATDTVLVRARVPSGEAVRPGQFVTVRIEVEERRDRLAVPVESIVQGDAGSEVAVVQGDTATRTRVTTGLREGGLVEVEGDGIREGAAVVVQGAYGLAPSSTIKVIGR